MPLFYHGGLLTGTRISFTVHFSPRRFGLVPAFPELRCVRRV
jgi:hypothetical protein